MSEQKTGGGATSEVTPQDVRWASLLVNATWAIIVVGVIVGVILWVAVDGATGEDLGALTWAITFTAAIAVMSVRQLILAERR